VTCAQLSDVEKSLVRVRSGKGPQPDVLTSKHDLECQSGDVFYPRASHLCTGPPSLGTLVRYD